MISNKNLTTPLLLLLSFIGINIWGQKIEVIQNGVSIVNNQSKVVEFFDYETDTSKFAFVATLKISGEGTNTSLKKIFEALKMKSIALGANCIRIVNLLDSPTTLIAETYYVNDSILKLNELNKPYNTIFIFGSDARTSETIGFKLNKEFKTVTGSTYFLHSIEKDSDVKILAGNVSFKFKWAAENHAAFILYHTPESNKPQVGITTSPMGGVGVRVGVPTGSFYQIDEDFGWFLTKIYTKSRKN